MGSVAFLFGLSIYIPGSAWCQKLFSGVSFDRPGFGEEAEAVRRRGGINCLKDEERAGAQNWLASQTPYVMRADVLQICLDT